MTGALRPAIGIDRSRRSSFHGVLRSCVLGSPRLFDDGLDLGEISVVLDVRIEPHLSTMRLALRRRTRINSGAWGFPRTSRIVAAVSGFPDFMAQYTWVIRS